MVRSFLYLNHLEWMRDEINFATLKYAFVLMILEHIGISQMEIHNLRRSISRTEVRIILRNLIDLTFMEEHFTQCTSRLDHRKTKIRNDSKEVKMG